MKTKMDKLKAAAETVFTKGAIDLSVESAVYMFDERIALVDLRGCGPDVTNSLPAMAHLADRIKGGCGRRRATVYTMIVALGVIAVAETPISIPEAHEIADCL